MHVIIGAANLRPGNIRANAAPNAADTFRELREHDRIDRAMPGSQNDTTSPAILEIEVQRLLGSSDVKRASSKISSRRLLNVEDKVSMLPRWRSSATRSARYSLTWEYKQPRRDSRNPRLLSESILLQYVLLRPMAPFTVAAGGCRRAHDPPEVGPNHLEPAYQIDPTVRLKPKFSTYTKPTAYRNVILPNGTEEDRFYNEPDHRRQLFNLSSELSPHHNFTSNQLIF